MKKILVLGAAGMAGHIVYTYLKETNKYHVFGTTNSNDFGDNTLKLDVFDQGSVEDILNKIKPDVVINCIGMLIRSSKENPDQTIYGNAYFPHFLKKRVGKIGAKLIHISTDCVFSGKKGGYTEQSFKDATDVYGLSKSLGEIIDEENLTIRTSIIGPEIKENGEGLFHWFMTQKSSSIDGFKSNFWSGVTTLELAKFIDWVIENPMIGLFHLTNSVPISKFDLLNIINEVYNKKVIIKSDRDYVCNKSFINTNTVDYVVPFYKQMLEEQKRFMENHSSFYNY
ncbi:dTDP-4-dehydrorhamnose reductase family protein [Riemerella anatipestifer]|uniref:dTDP-4-dehydrorhamnose reductase family protein n=1 Tax=Riemerella anatipestifer TaxID=34085 RepID=UPI00129DD2D3|nr:SDR family oxidoreductase [Riemerella anatipestifer]MRM97103.1 SDR family oxidoreductase [Riemerella anatipestifer]